MIKYSSLCVHSKLEDWAKALAGPTTTPLDKLSKFKLSHTINQLPPLLDANYACQKPQGLLNFN